MTSARPTADVDRVRGFAWYGRLSTSDRQDPALSFPSQRAACERLVTGLGSAITCEFTDVASGAQPERPGWSSLLAEARLAGRRFDAVAIYSTSRLARDRLYAALYERELAAGGVRIHYAMGGVDPGSPEGALFIGMQQLWDEFERQRLARETRRGMTELANQGYRAGGRAPYGYRRQVLAGIPVPDRQRPRVKLVADAAEAPVVREIFERYAHAGWGLKRIEQHLNRTGGPHPPRHVDPRRRRQQWAFTTVRAMLRNPIYTGALVWNRLDFSHARLHGGSARLRPPEQWVWRTGAHEAIVDEELWEATRARIAARGRVDTR